MINKTCQSFIY